jgi:hypothetical protein
MHLNHSISLKNHNRMQKRWVGMRKDALAQLKVLTSMLNVQEWEPRVGHQVFIDVLLRKEAVGQISWATYASVAPPTDAVPASVAHWTSKTNGRARFACRCNTEDHLAKSIDRRIPCSPVRRCSASVVTVHWKSPHDRRGNRGFTNVWRNGVPTSDARALRATARVSRQGSVYRSRVQRLTLTTWAKFEILLLYLFHPFTYELDQECVSLKHMF